MGMGELITIIFIVVILTFALDFLPAFNAGVYQNNVLAATDYLTNHGYVVLSASMYDTLNAKLDAIKVSADSAVINANAATLSAQNAVIAAQLAAAKVDLFNSAPVYTFPDTTARVVVLRAGSDANTFSAWSEILDSSGNALSTNFTSSAGYVEDIYIYAIDPDTQANSSWLLEIGYGSSNTTVNSILGKIMFHVDSYASYFGVAPIKSRLCPAGEKIYYRLMSTEPGGVCCTSEF